MHPRATLSKDVSGVLPRIVDFGREVAGQLTVAEQREWLVTNGIGGFACGSVAGSLTRRYHGLLVAALQPPLGRTLLVAKLEEAACYGGRTWPLGTNRWSAGTVAPEGYRHIERFHLEGTTPVWTFALADALIEKRVWMQPGANTTYVQYRLLRGSLAELELKALVNYRDYHGATHAGDWQMRIEPVEHGLRVTAFEGATPIHLLSARAEAHPMHEWYRDFDLPVERERGLDDREDHLHAATFCARLRAGSRVTVVLSTEAAPELDGRAAWEQRVSYEGSLLDRWAAAQPAAEATPEWVRHMVLAAEQFIVRRPLREDPEALSVIAGYPWFGDWGRDTMIALPGLTLATGRPAVARKILLTFARFVDQGMLPNVFPDAGETPEYNTVDAALWFFEAVRQYVAATQDKELLREIFPVLADMIDWHVRGTRYGIRVDSADGLLRAGEPGVQLTWMDAKVGDWVVTPRIGKPVEINALWYNALVAMEQFARLLGRRTGAYESLAKRARAGFERFWNNGAQCCYDVLDGAEGHDPSLRPNQVFAVALPASALSYRRQRAVVEACAQHLLTSHGLRSLAPSHPAYVGRYRGGPRERDAAYHRGTVWAWLLGPFVVAHLRVYNDPRRAAEFLAPLARHLSDAGMGSISEIFVGDPPFAPVGCFAQAWSVAEVLRAWTLLAAVGNTQPANPQAEARAATAKD